MESHLRTIVKSMSYRVFGTFATAAVAWFISGSAQVGLSIGLSDCVLKVGMFYAHERTWHRIKWGLVPTDRIDSKGDGI